VGLLLLETGIQLSLDGVTLALLSVGVAVVVIVAGYQKASALVVLGVGVVFLITQVGVPSPQLPAFTVGLPSLSSVSVATLEGTVAQLAMTVGNAAVATSLLLSDYYDADVSADELSTSMGVMNLFAIPLGAMPMCHGAGCRWKVRLRCSNRRSERDSRRDLRGCRCAGGRYCDCVPFADARIVLGLIAIELGRAGLDTDHLPLTLGIGLFGVATNIGIAFVVGALGYLLLEHRR